MTCNSCGRERGEDRCDCGAGRIKARKNGDVGRQLDPPRRVLKALWTYAGGALKKGVK